MISSGRLMVGLGATLLAGVTATAHATAQGGSLDKQHFPTEAANLSAGKSIAAPLVGRSTPPDSAPKNAHMQIYRSFALIQGHLLVGEELVQENMWDQALVHFLHLQEELNTSAAQHPELPDVTQLENEVVALVETVRARHTVAFQQSARSTQKRLTETLNTYKAITPAPLTRLTVSTVNEVLKIAVSEYDAAIDDGKFVNPVSYQDSRGFVWSAELLYVEHSKYLEKIDLHSLGKIRMLMNEIKAAYPKITPPASPVMDVSALAARVSRIKKLSSVYQ